MYDQCGLFWSPLIAKCQDPEIRIMFRCCSVYIVTVRNDFPRGDQLNASFAHVHTLYFVFI